MRKDLAHALTAAANAAGTSLAPAALLIARIEYPRLDVEAYLAKLDAMGELARQAGLHAITLGRLEAGATAPSTRTVRALATALGVEVAPVVP